MSSSASPRGSTNLMEDFLAREKAALEALDSVEITGAESNSTDMQIDEPMDNCSQVPVAHVDSTSPRLGTTHSPSLRSPIPTSVVTSNDNSFTSPPTSPTMLARRGARPETAAMKEWKAERNKLIAEREAAAEQIRNERKAKAASELNVFREEWKIKVESKLRKEREDSRVGAWDGEKSTKGGLKKEQVEWKKVMGLIETLPKPSKDCSRLMSIVKSLQDQ